MSFSAAAGFVYYAVHQMRIASSDVLRARLDRMLLSRFLPEGVAAEVVRGDEGAAGVSERHACLLSVDLRGFSVFTRERPSAEVIALLMEFRRITHDAVSANQGIIDKYIGDGVLALFLDGTPETQAERALTSVRTIVSRVDVWNDRRQRAGDARSAGRIRTIAALHEGFVLAGVFDDGGRAEFTVLGPAKCAVPHRAASQGGGCRLRCVRSRPRFSFANYHSNSRGPQDAPLRERPRGGAARHLDRVLRDRATFRMSRSRSGEFPRDVGRLSHG